VKAVIKVLQIYEIYTEVKEIDLSEDGWDHERYGIGESGWYEPFTDNLGELFKSLRKEYGRCVSRVYQDTPDGTADPVGWVFQKRVKYWDANETYLQETWVTYRQVKG
jgi:hypothetical protein